MYNKDLPLIDLHRHLDGNIRAKTIWELANKNGIKLPANSFEEFLPYVKIQKSEPDLISFLKKLDWGVAVLKSLDDVKRIAYENIEDASNAKLDYAELRFSPYYISMAHNLNMIEVIEALVDGIKEGTSKFGVKTNLIGILSRTFGVEICQKELDAILYHKDKIVALDLAGDEYNFPANMFKTHFKQARDAGLNITVHAGEAGGSQSMYDAIDNLGATRIGHGVACAKDEKLMQYMVKKGISIESCLTSNFQTGTIDSIENHPIKTFLNNGITVCLNTDDPAVEGIELIDEFKIAKDIVGLSYDEITLLQNNAIEMSFLSKSERDELIRR